MWRIARDVRGCRRWCARVPRLAIIMRSGAVRSMGRPAHNPADRSPIRTPWPTPAADSIAHHGHRPEECAAARARYRCAAGPLGIHQRRASHRGSATLSSRTGRCPGAAARSPHRHHCPVVRPIAARGLYGYRAPVAGCRVAIPGHAVGRAVALHNIRRPATPDCAADRRFRRGSAAASGDR
ncbi:hypothetical protein D3C76_1220330 [compost metagenome]